MTAGYWDGIVESWNEGHEDAVWRAHSDAVNASLLERWLPRRRLKNVLKTDLFDEAVAGGLYGLLKQRAENVFAIDLSPKVIYAARARHPGLPGIASDVLHLPFAEGSFDVVVSLSTLDHFDTKEKICIALQRLYRVMSPGGVLILTLDNASNPVIALRNRLPYGLLRWLRVVPYFVGATCTATEMVELLRRCSFAVDDLVFAQHSPRAAAILAARLVHKSRSASMRAWLLRLLGEAERLNRWRTRALTGYFVAALATKR
jgi:SAM-dependent methyltransferase